MKCLFSFESWVATSVPSEPRGLKSNVEATPPFRLSAIWGVCKIPDFKVIQDLVQSRPLKLNATRIWLHRGLFGFFSVCVCFQCHWQVLKKTECHCQGQTQTYPNDVTSGLGFSVK